MSTNGSEPATAGAATPTVEIDSENNPGGASAVAQSGPVPRPDRSDSRQGTAPPPIASTPPPAPHSKPSLWPQRLTAVASLFYEWVSRPAVRLAVTGLGLLLIGGLVMTNSVWTLPLVIAGGLMVVVAWIGRRLDGRLAVAWGETGTQLEFRAKIKAVQAARPTLTRTSSTAYAHMHRVQTESEHAEVVDGEAHTVEIDVTELKALIAAAQATEDETSASEQANRTLRVAYGGARGSEAGR